MLPYVCCLRDSCQAFRAFWPRTFEQLTGRQARTPRSVPLLYTVDYGQVQYLKASSDDICLPLCNICGSVPSFPASLLDHFLSHIECALLAFPASLVFLLVQDPTFHAKTKRNLKKEQDVRKLNATTEARLGLMMG